MAQGKHDFRKNEIRISFARGLDKGAGVEIAREVRVSAQRFLAGSSCPPPTHSNEIDPVCTRAIAYDENRSIGHPSRRRCAAPQDEDHFRGKIPDPTSPSCPAMPCYY
jgi:hypothetical protein